MKRLGPLFVVAIAMHVIGAIAWFALSFEDLRFGSSQRWWLVIRGCHVAGDALLAGGLFELARRRTGRARTAMIAGGGLVLAMIALVFVMRWVFEIYHGEQAQLVANIWSYLASAIAIAIAGTLAIAGWSTRAVAITGLALAVLARPIPLLEKAMVHSIASHIDGMQRVRAVMSLLHIAGIALLAFAACDGERSVDGRLAIRGLGRVGSALLVRVFASLVGSGLLILLLMGSHGQEGSLEVLRVAMMAAAVVNIVAQVMMTWGIVEAGVAGDAQLSPWALAIAAACAGWVAGALLEELPALYDMLYGQVGEADPKMAMPLATTIPLLVTAAVGIVAGTIGAYAGRRGLEELRGHASGKGVGFVVLMLASLGITSWIVPHAGSVGGLAIMLVCALLAAISAHLMGARLCALAAKSIDAQPELPSARVL